MQIRIHRGTHEIGGTCVELESQGKQLVLDIGSPLNVADPLTLPLYPVPGFVKPDASLLGVVISHPHQDRYGLAYRLPQEKPPLEPPSHSFDAGIPQPRDLRSPTRGDRRVVQSLANEKWGSPDYRVSRYE